MTKDAIKERVRTLTNEMHKEVIGFREHLHSHPELSFQEHKTAKFIKEKLNLDEVEWKTGIAGTGMMLRIQGNGPGKIIALRADMDALPITEKSTETYCSKNPGIMHACGHDVHSACLMGVARLMHSLRDHWNGELRLIFQLGEEELPGGASMMIKEGVLKSPDVECILAQHVFPELKAGQVGFRSGMYMASADEIYLTIKGKGGHGAMPQRNIDPVLISAHVLIALQQVISRRADPTMPSVLSFGKIQGNGATNVIPDEVKLEGTLRTFDEAWRKQAHTLIRELAEQTSAAMGGSCEVDIVNGYPFLKNDESLTLRCKETAEGFLGKEMVFDLPLRMTAEDFAYYSHEVPACFYRLGTASGDGRNSESVHTASFDIDAMALKTGVGLMSVLALDLLG